MFLPPPLVGRVLSFDLLLTRVPMGAKCPTSFHLSFDRSKTKADTAAKPCIPLVDFAPPDVRDFLRSWQVGRE